MKKLAITVVILFGLLVAADFGAAAVAEHQVAKQVRSQLALPRDPEVRINGFPFLTQVAAGDYRDVELSAEAVPVGEFRELGIEANLHHARLAPSDLFSGNVRELTVDELTGRVKVTAADVGRYIGIPDLRISPAPKDALAGTDGDEQVARTEDGTQTAVQLNGTVPIAGTENQVQIIALLSLVGGKLEIEPKKLDLDNSSIGPIDLPSVFEESVLRQFTFSLDPGMLPFQVTPTGVRAEHGALVIEGTVRDVTIGAGGVTTG